MTNSSKITYYTQDNESKIMLNNDSLETLLRANLSCFMGKTITHDLLTELTAQIIGSVEFFLNQEEILQR